ncbi:MAG: glutamine amidotransferase [Gemmatimonadales bacterium]
MNFWHVGNWCIHTGQRYIESPFLGPTKGVEILNYAQPLVDALAGVDEARVESEASWDLYNMSPERFAERLEWADVIVFGDVETKCLLLHPHFFNRDKWSGTYITFPDRLELLKQWVRDGGHFHMLGGWYSFSGELGKGGWGRSLFHDVLPVVCREGDDLVESTAGYAVRAPGAHPVLDGIRLEEFPPLLGFNQTALRDGADAILEIRAQDTWYPLLAAHRFGGGKVSAFTSSASPHWGINLVTWNQYARLWQQLFTRL